MHLLLSFYTPYIPIILKINYLILNIALNLTLALQNWSLKNLSSLIDKIVLSVYILSYIFGKYFILDKYLINK